MPQQKQFQILLDHDSAWVVVPRLQRHEFKQVSLLLLSVLCVSDWVHVVVQLSQEAAAKSRDLLVAESHVLLVEVGCLSAVHYMVGHAQNPVPERILRLSIKLLADLVHKVWRAFPEEVTVVVAVEYHSLLSFKLSFVLNGILFSLPLNSDFKSIKIIIFGSSIYDLCVFFVIIHLPSLGMSASVNILIFIFIVLLINSVLGVFQIFKFFLDLLFVVKLWIILFVILVLIIIVL